MHGKGPLPGAGGRPTDIFKRRMQTLASRAAEAKRLERLLADTNPDDKLFFEAFDRVTQHGFGRPAQSVDITSGGEKLLSADERQSRILALLEAAKGR